MQGTRHASFGETTELAQSTAVRLRELVTAEGAESTMETVAGVLGPVWARQFADALEVRPAADGVSWADLVDEGKPIGDAPVLGRGLFDHAEAWADRQGQTVVVTGHPYDANQHELGELEEFCTRNGLTYSVSAESWYFPGRTLRVAVQLTHAN